MNDDCGPATKKQVYLLRDPHIESLSAGFSLFQGPAGLAVQLLDLHKEKMGSIPTGPTHGEV